MASYYPQPVAPAMQEQVAAEIALIQAAQAGDIGGMQASLTVPGVDVNCTPHGRSDMPDTALQAALNAGQMGAAKWLLSNGASVNATGLPILARAAMRWTPEPYTDPVDPLCIAAASQHAKAAVTLLLQAGAEVNATSSTRGTALH